VPCTLPDTPRFNGAQQAGCIDLWLANHSLSGCAPQGCTLFRPAPPRARAAQPNGVALSPDGRALYVTDTARMHARAPKSAARTIYRYDVTWDGPGRCRQLANRRVFAMAAVGAPDGIKARRCTRAGQAHRVMRLLLARSSLCMLRCHMRCSGACNAEAQPRACAHFPCKALT